MIGVAASHESPFVGQVVNLRRFPTCQEGPSSDNAEETATIGRGFVAALFGNIVPAYPK
jgi:hypothetical protein